MINVSGKAVSKWERGDGFPDVSIFPLLGAALGADTEELIQGISDAREAVSGNTKKQYPEWDLGYRIPAVGHGMLVWHCSRHGLFYMNI